MRADLLFGAFLILSIGSAAAQEGDLITVDISSSVADASFSALCVFEQDGARVSEDLSGTAPATLRFDADSVRCDFASDGPLTVIATGPRGNRSQTQTSGGRISLTFS